MSLSKVLEQIKMDLEANGYKVYTHPIDTFSDSTIFLDFNGITVLDTLSGGYEVSVDISLVLFTMDRVKLINTIEEIVSILNYPTLEFTGCNTTIVGENTLANITFRYVGVINYE